MEEEGDAGEVDPPPPTVQDDNEEEGEVEGGKNNAPAPASEKPVKEPLSWPSADTLVGGVQTPT